MGRRIDEARNVAEEELNLTKDHRKVIEYISNALWGLENPSAVLSLCQFYLTVCSVKN